MYHKDSDFLIKSLSGSLGVLYRNYFGVVRVLVGRQFYMVESIEAFVEHYNKRDVHLSILLIGLSTY